MKRSAARRLIFSHLFVSDYTHHHHHLHHHHVFIISLSRVKSQNINTTNTSSSSSSECSADRQNCQEIEFLRFSADAAAAVSI
jgi:hypothetical protein